MNAPSSVNPDGKQPKLLDQVRSAMRLRRYSIRTEDTYLQLIRRFILFHNKRHPLEMGSPEINQFLSHLATGKDVASTTRNQALERKHPHKDCEWGWQVVFPSRERSVDPRTHIEQRHHIDETVLQRALKEAAKKARIHELVGPPVLCHSFAAHHLEAGHEIRTVQEFPEHEDVQSVMIYTPVLNKGGMGVQSAADRLR